MKGISILFALFLVSLLVLTALAESASFQSGTPTYPNSTAIPPFHFFLPAIHQDSSYSSTSTPTLHPTITLTPSPTEPLPDLEAWCCTVDYEYSCPDESPGHISGYVHNNGPGNAGSFFIDLNSGGDPIGPMWRFVPGLEAHSSEPVAWDFTSGPVIDNVYVWADSKNQVAESNEHNNISARSTGTPYPPCTPGP